MKVGLRPNFLANIPLMKEVQPEINDLPCHVDSYCHYIQISNNGHYLRDVNKVCICQRRVNVVPHVGYYIGHEVSKGKHGRDADLE